MHRLSGLPRRGLDHLLEALSWAAVDKSSMLLSACAGVTVKAGSLLEPHAGNGGSGPAMLLNMVTTALTYDWSLETTCSGEACPPECPGDLEGNASHLTSGSRSPPSSGPLGGEVITSKSVLLHL